jgi:hypothetical protein
MVTYKNKFKSTKFIQKVNFQEQLHAVPDEEYGTRVPAGRRAAETYTEKHKQQVKRVRKEDKSR